MKRFILLFVGISLFSSIGEASADPYKLLMSKEKGLCATMLGIFNKETDDRGGPTYEHTVFTTIKWSSVELSGREPLAKYCSVLKTTTIDINNDGADDLVIKASFCVKGQPIDSLYIFPPTSDVIKKMTWQNMRALFETTNKIDSSGHAHLLSELDPSQNDGLQASRTKVSGTFLLTRGGGRSRTGAPD